MNRIPQPTGYLDTRLIEWFLAVHSVLWGVVLLTRPTLFETSNSFDWLAHRGTERQYGAAVLTLGVLKLASATAGRLTWLTAIGGVVFWSWVASGLYFAHHAVGTGVVTYGWLCVGGNLYVARFGARRACRGQ